MAGVTKYPALERGKRMLNYRPANVLMYRAYDEMTGRYGTRKAFLMTKSD
jgi:hypothetical protein